MRGYYITSSSIIRNYGIKKKIDSQIRVLQSIAEVDLVPLDPIQGVQPSIPQRLPWLLPWTLLLKWQDAIPRGQWDFLYIRKHMPLDRGFIAFLKKCKSQKNKRIVLEIPTYPYDSEYHGVKRLFVFKDRIFRPYLKEYVDRILTFSQDDTIFEIPTIKIINGIDVNAEKIREYRPHGNTINLILVAALAWWHGCDRLIKGLAEYYAGEGREKIVLHIVSGLSGTSRDKVLRECKSLVKRNRLEAHVVFHGGVYGEDLTRLYNSMDIGVCSLGAHRKRVDLSSELKSREYLAKGLPLIVSTPIDVITDDFPYWLKVPADESPIDIENVVKFFHERVAPLDPDILSQTIRAYAKEHCDMKVTMKPVLDYLRQSDNEEY